MMDTYVSAYDTEPSQMGLGLGTYLHDCLVRMMTRKVGLGDRISERQGQEVLYYLAHKFGIHHRQNH
jgi:hypothetical protein